MECSNENALICSEVFSLYCGRLNKLGRGAGVVERAGLENRCGCTVTVGSNPTLSAINRIFHGEMTEWSKVHDWKSCVGSPPTVGSNPTLSAIIGSG